MAGKRELEEHYGSLSNMQLLELWSDGGFTEEAAQMLRAELQRRGISAEEIGRYELPPWLEEAQTGDIALLTLADGERLTAELQEIDEDFCLHLREVASQGGAAEARERVIPFHEVRSYEPQPQLLEQWPYCDPCRNAQISMKRVFLRIALLLGAVFGSLFLFLTLKDRPYGLQLATVFSYTLGVVFLTFYNGSRRRESKAALTYMFTCPVVLAQTPRLLRRHLLFVVGVLIYETALPYLFSGRAAQRLLDGNGDLLNLTIMFSIFAAGYVEVVGNWTILKRAHKQA